MTNPDLLSQLLVITPSYEGVTYPGSLTARAVLTHLGLGAADYLPVAYDDELFDEFLHEFQGTVALCFGAEALYRLTGITISQDKERGYVFLPEDFLPKQVKVRDVIGSYKRSNKTKGIAAGDPKYGNVTKTISPIIPPNLRYVIVTLPPRKIEESGKRLFPAFRADVSRAIRFSRGEATLLSPHRYVTTPEAGETITLDIETEGFTGAVTHLAITSSSAPFDACSLTWNTKTKLTLQSLINSCTTVQGHNLAFDIPRLEREGIDFSGKARFDTMLANILLFPDMLKGLERASTIFLNLRPWKFKSGLDMFEYNALDAFITHHLAAAQRDQLVASGMYELFTENIMPASVVLQDMCKEGICVDRIALEAWTATLRKNLQKAITEWHDHTWTYRCAVDPLSPPQLIRFFYTNLGMARKYAPRKKKTETLSVDEDAVNRLIFENPNHAPMLKSLLEVRKWNKQLKTYAGIRVTEQGRVHPSYLPYQKIAGSGGQRQDEDENKGYASTGRPTSRDPNIQNQTLESKAIFITSDPRSCFVEFDFSQIELRIAAALSGDQAMQNALTGDIHARTMELLGCDRVHAKAVTFGTMYGAGPDKLIRILRESGVLANRKQCEALQYAFSRAYPDLWAWRSSIPAIGIAQHYLTNPFKRRRYFYGGKDQTTEMFNYLPQSTVADILIKLLPVLAAFARKFAGRIVATVHDSVLFEFPILVLANQFDELVSELRSIAECEWPQVSPGFRVPIQIKMGTPGGSWATVSATNFESFGKLRHL